MARLWLEGSVHTETIFQFVEIQIEHGHGEYIANPKLCWKGNFHERITLAGFK